MENKNNGITYAIFGIAKDDFLKKDYWKYEVLIIETNNYEKFQEAKKWAVKNNYSIRIILTSNDFLEKPNFTKTINI